MYLFRRSSQVVHRVKLTSVLLQLEHDIRLREGDVGALAAANQNGQVVFQASADISDGVLLLDAYLGPLLGALSPFVWAISAPRALGTIIYSLGRPLQGEWWAGRLDALFGVTTDPAIFTDRNQRYRPPAHLHARLSVEQLFRGVHSLQIAHRDANARRALLFTVLDTLERLTALPIERLCSLRLAREKPDELEQQVPAAAASILLPAARRAVDALNAAQDGLYLLDQIGAATISIPDRNGRNRVLDRDAAIGEYLKVRRDATPATGRTEPTARPSLTPCSPSTPVPCPTT